MISPKPLDQIIRADIDQLVVDGTAEKRTIEYKQSLPGMGDGEKKEFLADISSIANAQGGDLVYGIGATDGVPTEARGLADFNFDATKLRLESLTRDGLDPRLHGVQFHSIEGFADGPVLILRIPRSWTGPHRVKLGGSSRFYSRGSAGKFEMDTADIRSAIESSGDLPKRIRDWRDERLGRIIANDGAFPLTSSSILVVHLLPLDAFSNTWRFDPRQLRGQMDLQPIGARGWNNRINVDGFATFDPDRDRRGSAQAYTQLFRSGIIEAVCARLVETDQNDNRYIPSGWYERSVIESVERYMRCLENLGLNGPIVYLLTLIGIKGTYLFTNVQRDFDVHFADRDLIVVPDLLVEDVRQFQRSMLRPAFDAIWNAFGYDRSYNFDHNGEWVPR